MKRFLLVAITLSLLTMTADAQQGRNCGTMSNHDHKMATDPLYAQGMQEAERLVQEKLNNGTNRMAGTTIYIPVVFHIVYNTNAPSQNISNARIQAQLDVLNNDYSSQNADIVNTPSVFAGVIPAAPTGTGIQFVLAQRDPNGNPSTGILRIPTSVGSFAMMNDPIKFTSSGGSDAWPRDEYLNIWVGNLSNGILGYAQFPNTQPGAAATDGVALLYTAVGGPTSPGTIQNYNLGRTATHEIGHWLNLRHIWGDNTCGNDQVGDTPTQQTYNFNCPNFPHVSACTGNATNGDMFMNYMDYVDDDCMVMFTNGQVTRMAAALSGPRAAILTSLGGTPVGIGENTESLPGINIYPNPAVDHVIIQNSGASISDAHISVLNNSGQLVASYKFDQLSESNRIDISHLANGVYMVEVNALNKKSVNRFVIDRK
jgi:hypothetical protein